MLQVSEAACAIKTKGTLIKNTAYANLMMHSGLEMGLNFLKSNARNL